MANLLNYKYEIFPTEPQRKQLNRILRESRLQWNKAVTIRKKLKRAFEAGQIEYVIRKCLTGEEGKRETNHKRKGAILKILEEHPSLNINSATKLYNLRNIIGKDYELDEKTIQKLNLSVLAKEIKKIHKLELAKRKEAQAKGDKKVPKLTVYWRIMNAINRYAGHDAKTYMDKSFQANKKMSLSVVRFNISGSAKSIRWNQAVNPKPQQRTYGARGEPQYKRRGDGFAYQIQNTGINEIVREKRQNRGHQIYIGILHKGNAWIDTAYHREIPEYSKIKQVTINTRSGRYFVVLSIEVPESVWAINSMETGWHAGIDPGAETALTIGLNNVKTGKLSYLQLHYGFLEKGLDKLDKNQKKLALKQGPRRKRTEEEIKDATSKYANKRKIQKLSPEERKKEIDKEKARLERTMIRQESSKKWRQLSQRTGAINLKIANQRADVLHKVSRMLAEGCDLIGIGDWEPTREVGYRKKVRMLKKNIRKGVKGAEEELKSLQEEKTKQGPRGIKKVRRGGRDRSIATLRRYIEEKTERASVQAYTKINESRTTMTCCVCGETTGPKGDTSIREWQCSKCNAFHHRDINASLNILKKTEEVAAQATSSATGITVIRTNAQGAKTKPESGNGFGRLATGHSGRIDTFFYKHAYANLSNLWEVKELNALKSLIQMGITKPLTLQKDAKIETNSPF